MKNTRQNNCDDVIDLLVKKYWSESKSELEKKIGQIAQDFIGRKLYNSTVRINKQLHTEYDFLLKLIEHIIESMKQDFSHIPLATCKEKLLSIVEIEYKKLIPNTTSRLVQANLGQKDILEQYKNGILGKMEKAKEKIEIHCAISEKEEVSVKHDENKWYKNRTIQAALITAGVFLFASIIGWLIFIYYDKSSSSSEITTSGDSSPGISTSGPNSPVILNYESPKSRSPSDSNNLSGKTLIYENIRNKVSGLEHQIIDEKIAPWIFFRTGKMKEVTNYHGKVIKYSGIEFAGSPRLIFWNGFIEPFLENGIAQVLNTVAQECYDRNIDNTEFLQEAKSLLAGLISKAYRRMSEIDQKLRGKGYPEKVTPVDVSNKIGKMQEFLNQYTKAILNNEKPPRKRYD
jgi:hypothetical protein